ncbi:hypothetical protein CBR_g56128 [Chara braunii]|uniref:Uncharacterized protein n=1 Tax=Chara braunii TaxID=69332 RepID=A0A388MDN4_CHABU|nr:hypothetical protein CBR_g56128 [Chara braunii]|eukprot:GBG92592.1 hypothetical protein CBR_g56128 [Chara braunii]
MAITASESFDGGAGFLTKVELNLCHGYKDRTESDGVMSWMQITNPVVKEGLASKGKESGVPVKENKRDHNKGKATDVDSAQVGGSGEDIEGSMCCGRQVGESSGGRHIGGRDIQYRERHVEQQGRQASSTKCEDRQLEQNEPNMEEDESEDGNNRDSDDFGERESNEDEDDDNEEICEDGDENDAHCKNEKAIVMRGHEKRDASEKSKVNNRISDNIHTLYAHSKIVKQLMRCVAKTFCLSRAKDAEMCPSVDMHVDAFMGLTESLDLDTRFIVDRSMKSTTPTTLRTQGSKELTNIRGEIAYDIVRAFWSATWLPYPCETVRDRFEKEKEEMKTKMVQDSSWRVRGEEPWGATEFKNAVRDVLYRDWNEIGRNGCTLQQLEFAHMVLDCHISNKSRPARTAAASKEMRRIEEAIVTTCKTGIGKVIINLISLDRNKTVVQSSRNIWERQFAGRKNAKDEVVQMKNDHRFLEFLKILTR